MHCEDDEMMVVMDLRAKNIKLCVVTEGHWMGSGDRPCVGGHHHCKEYHIVYSGHASNHIRGVGFILHRDIYQRWVQGGKKWHPISERIVTLTLPIAGLATKQFLTLVGVYAPTNDPKHRADSDLFYEELQAVIDRLPSSHLTMVLGDFNARVGGFDEDLAKLVGRYANDVTNENGGRLMHLCVKNDLAVMGTFFPHKPTHKYTWVHASTGNRYMIDHVLMPVKFKGCVKDWRTVQHHFHTNADHRLVRMEVSFKVSLKRGPCQAVRKRLFDRSKCLDDNLVKAYMKETDGIAFDAPHDDEPFQHRFESWVRRIQHAFHTHFKVERSQKRKGFVSDATYNLIEQKKRCFLLWHEVHKLKGSEGYDEQLDLTRKRVYRTAANVVKRAVQRDKKTWIDDMVTQLENAGSTRKPDFFKRVRSIFAPKVKRAVNIRDKEGQLLDTEGERLSRWHEWGEAIFDVQPSARWTDDDYARVSGGLGRYESGDNAALRDSKPTEVEIARAVAKLASNKAADRDGVIAEMLKSLGKGALLEVAKIIHEIWDTETGPASWSTVDIIPVYKGKGDVTQCDSYRPISLIDMISKAFGTLIRARVEKLVDPKLHECQAGFRKGRSCQDMIFTLRMLRGYANEYRVPMHACFVDLKKAYDSIDREALWRILPLYNVDGKLLEMIKLLYVDLGATVKVSDSRSERISLKAGVKQGCVLSPLLFNIYLDFVIKNAISGWNTRAGVHINRGERHMWSDPSEPTVFRRQQSGLIIQALLYADDTALLATSHEELEEMLNYLHKCMTEWGLRISFEKTEAMAFGAAAEGGKKWPPLKVGDQQVNYVDKFKYLGSIFTSLGGDSTDCTTRISKAWACYHSLKKILKAKYLSVKTRIGVYKVTVMPTLLYGAESWVLCDEEVEKLEVVQMRMLRSILNVSLREKRTNPSIRQEAQVPPIRNKLAQLRLAWFGKVIQMDLATRWPVGVLCGSIWGKGNWRKKGRPPLRWTDLVLADMIAVGVDRSQCDVIARDRKKWSEVCLKARDSPEEPVPLLECGGQGCQFFVSSNSEMAVHRRQCDSWIALMRSRGGRECVDGCGFVAKSVGGLKTHQRSCRVLLGLSKK